MNTSGGSQVNLTNHRGERHRAELGSGRHPIAFVSTRTGSGDIYSMDANGSNRRCSKATLPRPAPHSPLRATSSPGRGTPVPRMTSSAERGFRQHRELHLREREPRRGPRLAAVNNTYARPVGASPVRLPFVPAYKECTAPNTTHRGFNQPSCYGPKPESNWLTVGTPEYNGAGPTRSGYVRIAPSATEERGEDATLPDDARRPARRQDRVDHERRRCQTVSTGCTGALADDTGLLWFFSDFRLTDKNNGPPASARPGTRPPRHLTVDFGVPCTATGSTAVGTPARSPRRSTVLGSNTAIAEQKRGIWELAGGPLDRNMRLYDGGSNGTYKPGDTVFATAGLFFP